MSLLLQKIKPSSKKRNDLPKVTQLGRVKKPRNAPIPDAGRCRVLPSARPAAPNEQPFPTAEAARTPSPTFRARHTRAWARRKGRGDRGTRLTWRAGHSWPLRSHGGGRTGFRALPAWPELPVSKLSWIRRVRKIQAHFNKLKTQFNYKLCNRPF